MTRIRSRLAEVARGIRTPERATGAVAAPDTTLYERLAPQLPQSPDQVVVILADADTPVPELVEVPHAGRRIVLSESPVPEWGLEERGVEHLVAEDLDKVNWHLRFVGPLDVIVDAASRTSSEYGSVWQKLFLHLVPNGTYVIDRSRAKDREVPAYLLELATTLGLTGATLWEAPLADRSRRHAMLSLTVDDAHIVVRKRGKHVLKVRDRLANRLLPVREPQLEMTELRRLPAGTMTSRAVVHSHTSSVEIKHLESAMDYPTHHLRHYRGEISMVANALLHTGSSALPDSFRHHLAYWPKNPALIDASGDFGRVRPKDLATTRLPGTYYHLDSENPGHYGHLMTEVVSRLWGWDLAKSTFPDLKAIFRLGEDQSDPPVLEQRVLAAYGIAPQDIVWTTEPVVLESVVGATPMWHNQIPHYAHPDLLDVWRRLRTSFLDEAPASDHGFAHGGERIFVSRQDISVNRACRNTRDVEAYFVRHGFDVVYPELYDLAEQAAIFAGAEVIAGFGGSAMFNILFSDRQPTTILLNHEAYTARNEHLFTSLLGGDVHYFWSTPDVSHPPDGWDMDAYYSSWEFDFERNTAELDALLDGLS